MSALNIVHGVQFKVTENDALSALEIMLEKAEKLQEVLDKALVLNVDGNLDKSIKSLSDSVTKMQKQVSDSLSRMVGDYDKAAARIQKATEKMYGGGSKNGATGGLKKPIKIVDENEIKKSMGFLAQLENQIEELVALRGKVDVLDPNAEQKIMAYTRQLTNLRRQMTNLTTVSGIGGGLTGFQFAISQVLRETPTLLYSVQTYILAISNNLPILADEFKNLKGTGESALKGVIRALTSLSGVMVIATLSAQMFIKWLEDADKEANEAAEAVDRLSKSLKELSRNSRVELAQEMQKFTRLVKIAKEDTDGQNYALKVLNDEYANGIAKLTSIKDLNDDIIERMQKQLKLQLALNTASKMETTLFEQEQALSEKKAAGLPTSDRLGAMVKEFYSWFNPFRSNSTDYVKEAEAQFDADVQSMADGIKDRRQILNDFLEKVLKELVPKNGESGGGGSGGNNMTDLLTDLLIDLEKLNNEISGSGFLTDMQTALDISAKHTRDWEVEMSELNKEIAKANELHKEGKLLYPAQTFAAFEAIKAQKEMLKVIKERIELEKQAQRTTLDGLDLVTRKIDLIIARQKKRNEAIKSGSSQGDLLDGNIRLFTSEAMREDANDIADLTADLFKLTNQIADLEEKARRAGKSVREITTGDEFDNYEAIKKKIIPSIRENIDLIQAQSDARYGVATAEAVMDWIGMAQTGNADAGRASAVQTELQATRAMQGASRLFGGRQRLSWRMQKELMQNNINVAGANLNTSRAGATELEGRRSSGINVPEEQMLRAKEKVAEDELAFEQAKLEKEDAMYNHKIETLNTYLDAYSEMANQIVSVSNMMADAQIAALDREISARQNSIDYAVRLAERGNTDLINEEREMLRQSMAEREKMARKQMAINTALMISESLVAVARAAAQGGGIGSILTVAAAVAAMAAGVISVVSLANDSKPGFFDGGYTGDGNPREVAGVVHKQEVVFNHKDVARLGGKDVVESIRKGNLPVAMSPFAVGGQEGRVEALENKLDEVIDAVRESKLQQSIFFNEHGVGIMAQKAIVNDARRFARK